VRLLSKNGTDWTGRYRWIVEAARMIRQKRFVLDGEAVILGVDGLPTSTRFTPGSTITRFSSAPSTSSWKAATISGSFRSTCARTRFSGFWRAVQRAFSSTRSSAGRSVPIYSARRAAWD
jgi:hypothetical protein